VTDPVNNSPTNPRTEFASRIGWTILIVATLYICYFSHLGAIGFVGPDEPRYAWIARAMVETGDWVTPRLYGKPWFEKPVLYYWGAAVSFKVFGVNEAAARLPSAVSALLATLALAWLALRVYGAETARWLLLILPTTVGMIGFSHAAATDMPFSAMLTIAMVCAAVVLRLVPRPSFVVAQHAAPPFRNQQKSRSTPSLALVLFGFFLGLAVLAKGPAAILLCGGAVLFWASFAKRWRDAFRLLHPAAIAAFCATSLPWYILCAHRNSDFLRVFIIEHNFKRYLTAEFQHIQPFWFYGPILLIAFLPWTLGLLAGAFNFSRADEQVHHNFSQELFLLSFGIFPMLFFSASQSKLPGYVLPSIGPFASLLIARSTILLSKSQRGKLLLPLLSALTSLGLAIAIERFAAHRVLGQDILAAPWTRDVWIPLLLAALAAVILAGMKRSVPALCVLHIGLLLSVLGLYNGLRWTDSEWSARGVLEAAHTQLQSNPSDRLFVYNVPRGIQYGLNFYLHRELQQWAPNEDATGFVFTSRKTTQALEASGYRCTKHIVYPTAVLCRAANGESSSQPSP
jgi:4-amino-4-deoxy-L-arabinose transferase-like glycosyltransferase